MMARVLLVHGAFNEFWGPYELKARLLPTLRDGLWHHDMEIDEIYVWHDSGNRGIQNAGELLVEKEGD
jgi:hypothetical protein